jgi:hypothetical protein
MSQTRSRNSNAIACLLAAILVFQIGCRPTPPPPSESPKPEVAETPSPTPQPETPPPTPEPTPEPTPVAPPKPEKFEISAQPFASTAGRPLDPPPAARITNSAGLPVPNMEVSVAISKNAFTDSSAKKATTNEEGVAVFNNLVVEKSESFYQLEFSANGFQPIRSVEFDVRFAAPRAMAIVVQPTTSRKGKPVEGPPAVQIVDSFGNPVPRVAVEVRLQAPGKGKLSGTTRATTDQKGEVKFDNLIPQTANPKEVLLFDAKAAGIPDLTSEPFRVR